MILNRIIAVLKDHFEVERSSHVHDSLQTKELKNKIKINSPISLKRYCGHAHDAADTLWQEL